MCVCVHVCVWVHVCVCVCVSVVCVEHTGIDVTIHTHPMHVSNYGEVVHARGHTPGHSHQAVGIQPLIVALVMVECVSVVWIEGISRLISMARVCVCVVYECMCVCYVM